jgi:ribonuclease D
MASLPIRRYEGEARLIDSSLALEHALADIRAERVVGFDTETRPAFRRGESYLPSLAQVATARAVHLFPLQRMDFSAALAELLGAPGIVKAGIGIGDDLKALKKLFAFQEASVIDVGSLAKKWGIEQTGLRNLAGIVLGIRIPKGKRTSNWAAAKLTRQQIFYAAMDAWAVRELYLKLEIPSANSGTEP